ncbi:TetR/AcrR family transcriptional regulator C-terminal domain-containing protein [Kitasatospora kifunensis]|uniref:AcrR family transcriptional regulator n=1 Tax=Kitasatospora kifunensis TaxID=58351 RepID=A0A7W7R084_KITKI|nr:GntR family transcriptional regulator [Kitasatospora kifunensis]MBB4923058.1 AcrR family transcriptional regulator [Kitasatospora kifunensis]
MPTAPDAPPYLRIAAELRGRIAAGTLKPGDRVPSTRQITQEWGVAMATATKVLATLRREGLVRSRPGAGTVVAAPLPATLAAPPPTPAPAPSATPTRRREPRGGDQGLTRERIIQAAITIADAEGLTTLTMRRVAAELGVATMALYRHVASKEELGDLMADTVLNREPLPPADLTGWRERLTALARLQWSLYRRHPWLARTISLTRPVPLPGALQHGEWVLATVKESGLPPATRLHIHLMMFAVVRGIAVNLEPQAPDQATSALTDEEWMQSQEALLQTALGTGQYPTFSALLTELDAETGADDFALDLDQLFEFVLARTLDGLALLFDPPTGLSN